MTMQHRGKGFGNAKPIVIRPYADFKQDKAIRAERIRVSNIGMAMSQIADDHPELAAWLCLQVRPRAESAIEDLLAEEKVHALVPRYKGPEMRRRHRNVEAPMLPVMPGYVLVRCVPTAQSVQGLLTFDRQKRVVGIVGDPERPFRVPFAFIERFLQKVQAGAYDYRAAAPVEFAVGESVRIVDGPFASYLGKILSTDYQKCRVEVEVRIFSGLVPVEMDVAQIEKM
ncbi:transcription termination/antitermination protein NusG [Rhizobium sp. CC-YZS058]|uniref:transcription termination/antitermination protein NusG n=1 Tax=Rhizobium sp. CC-YZS058 TaxID=3042153 RepID=UPI002B057F4F|nr:transcription termination/antitermination protein NusG [Rhizobium sp. CC-YZS058]MEA3534270.1 transcription termination/antitermination protein NusG [Rhizobium sp. CC-YZS058]